MGDPLVECVELFLDGPALMVEVLPFTPEPFGSAFRSPLFTSGAIECSVCQHVGPPRDPDLGVAVEGGDRGQCLFEAVVAAPRIFRTAVVDQLPVGVGAGIGSDQEAVAIAERILDRGLEGRILEVIQSTVADNPRLGQVLEPGRGVGAGDVVADVAQVYRVEAWGVPGIGGQAELVAEVVSEDVGVVVRVPGVRTGRRVVDIDVQVCGGRVLGADDIDQQTVAAEKSLTAVEGSVGAQLGVFEDLL
ncbi:hypothetical protein NG2371_01848 [Nocardia gamkensis]|nr:hypothetical protein [Nocardia gamkensis]NQE67396.1 hypothetical protein [Nocardia gamkensis]